MFNGLHPPLDILLDGTFFAPPLVGIAERGYSFGVVSKMAVELWDVGLALQLRTIPMVEQAEP